MDTKKRKSILQTQSSKEEDPTVELRSKRVSFSGKKFVREFQDHDWESYEISDRVDTSNSGNKSNLQITKAIEPSSLLCTTHEYINKCDYENLNLESTACISLIESEKLSLQTKLPSKGHSNKQMAKEKPQTQVEPIKEAPKPQQNSKKDDGTKLIFFNENSNKENIAPQAEAQLTMIGDAKTKPFDDTLSVFDDTLKNKVLLSESDESFITKSFHHDLQRINEHVAPTDTTLCEPPADLKGEEKPTSGIEAPKIIVRHLSTPMRLLKGVHKAQGLSSRTVQQQQQKQQYDQQFQQLELHGIDDTPTNKSDIGKIGCSFGSFCIQSNETSAESSPLLPPEYRANYQPKVDLEKLSADIESGKVKLFSRSGNLNRKITTPLNFKTRKVIKDATVLELENSFWGNSNPNDVDKKKHLELTNYVAGDIEMEVPKVNEPKSVGVFETTQQAAQNVESENSHAVDIETELTENKKNALNMQTILFQNVTIDEEVEASQQTEIVASEMEMTTAAISSYKQVHEKNTEIEKCSPKNPKDENTNKENSEHLVEAIEVIPSKSSARRGTIFFECEEIDVATKESIEKRRTVNRTLFLDPPNKECFEEKQEQIEIPQKVYARRETCYVNESITEETDERTQQNETKYTGAIPKNVFTEKAHDNSLTTQSVKSTDTRRKTSYASERISEEAAAKPKSMLNFLTEQQDLSIEQSAYETTEGKDKRRLTCHFNESISEDQLNLKECSVVNAVSMENAHEMSLEHIEGCKATLKDKTRKTYIFNESISEEYDLKIFKSEQRMIENQQQHNKTSFAESVHENIGAEKGKPRLTCHINESILEEQKFKKSSHAISVLKFPNNALEMVEAQKTTSTNNRRKTCHINKTISEEIELEGAAITAELPPMTDHSALETTKDKRRATIHIHKSIFDESGFDDVVSKPDMLIKHKEIENATSTEPTQYFENEGLLNETNFKTTEQEGQKNYLHCLDEQSVEKDATTLVYATNAAVVAAASFEQMDISFQSLKAPNTHKIADESMQVDDVHNFKVRTFPSSLKKTPNKLRKSVCFSVDIEEEPVTPRTVRSIGMDRCTKYMETPATPHRSLLEFEYLESKAKNADDDEFNANDSLAVSVSAGKVGKKNLKRDTTNLTPILSLSKKHQPNQSHLLDFSYIKNESCDEINDLKKKRSSEDMMTKSHVHTSTDEALDRTEPPSCFFENISINETIGNNTAARKMESPIRLNKSLTSMSASTTATTPSRIPVHTGTTMTKQARISSPNLQNIVQLDMLDTIEEGRFATTLNCAYETKNGGVFENDEDVPITISDVTQHYMSLKSKVRQEMEDQEMTTSFVDVNSGVDKSLCRSICEEITAGIAECRELMDITNDPEKLEEYRLRQLEEKDRMQAREDPAAKDVELQDLFAFSAKDAIAKVEGENAVMSREECFQQKAFVCRKCVRCQESIMNETVEMLEARENSADLSMRPTRPQLRALLDKFMPKMEESKGSKWEDTLKIVEELRMERLKNGLEASVITMQSDSDDEDEEHNDYGDSFLKEYYEAQKREKEFIEKLKRTPNGELRLPFVPNLEYLLRQQKAKDWIYNFGWQAESILKFRHRICLGFQIILQYEELNSFGTKVNIKNIEYHESTIDEMPLTPIFYIKLFQIKLELGMVSNDLTPFCNGNTAEDVMEMLEKINVICSEVLERSNDLWLIAFKYNASMKTENNRSYVEKIARKSVYDEEGLYHHTEKTEFRIEITNMRKLCYKNIITPSLFLLKENIATLPVGLEFLNTFLKDPLSYLKCNNDGDGIKTEICKKEFSFI